MAQASGFMMLGEDELARIEGSTGIQECCDRVF